MGYYTFAVGVRIKELQAAIGSNDQRLLERVRLGEYFSNYEAWSPTTASSPWTRPCRS